MSDSSGVTCDINSSPIQKENLGAAIDIQYSVSGAAYYISAESAHV